jgi:hydrogenase-4 component C
VTLFLSIFLPFGSLGTTSAAWPAPLAVAVAVAAFVVKVTAFYFVAAVIENAMARLSFLKAPAATWAALGAAILSFVFYLANV